MVSTFSGQTGIVLAPEELQKARETFKEGNHPGRYFAQGCCQHPDFIIQIPVLFEDETFDVMRAMNIKKVKYLAEERQRHLKGLIEK